MNGLVFTSCLALAAVNQIVAFYLAGKKEIPETTFVTTLGVIALQGLVAGLITPIEFTGEAIGITVVMLYAIPLGKGVARFVDKHRLQRSAQRALEYGREIESRRVES